MKANNHTKSKSFFTHVFGTPVDFYALLDEQAAKTLEGMQALLGWLNEEAGEERCQVVRDLENEADELKLTLGRKLQDSFITPFDREDIYELSINLDEVINAAKAIAREIEAFGVSPAKHHMLRDMGFILVVGSDCLHRSIRALRTDLSEASRQAMMARKLEKRLNKVYRQAMRELIELDDIKEIMRVREVYKAMLLAAERIDVMGERLMHAIMKMS
jgi:uncharacterized protein